MKKAARGAGSQAEYLNLQKQEGAPLARLLSGLRHKSAGTQHKEAEYYSPGKNIGSVHLGSVTVASRERLNSMLTAEIGTGNGLTFS